MDSNRYSFMNFSIIIDIFVIVCLSYVVFGVNLNEIDNNHKYKQVGRVVSFEMYVDQSKKEEFMIKFEFLF